MLFKADVLKTLYPVSISVKFKLIKKLHIKVKILLAKNAKKMYSYIFSPHQEI